MADDATRFTGFWCWKPSVFNRWRHRYKRKIVILGIRKLQWVLVLLALLMPLVLNAVALWFSLGTSTLMHVIVTGTYNFKPLGVVRSPLIEVWRDTLLTLMPVGLLAWLTVFISTRAFLVKSSAIGRQVVNLLLASIVAVVSAFITAYFLPLTWLPRFYDFLLGLPISDFMQTWSWWFVLPGTFIVLFWAMFFPHRRTGETGGENPEG